MKRLATCLIILTAILAATATTSVDLINIGPGSDIYELEGHSALRINDVYGHDVAISWGEFDFDSPGFVYRFVSGETDYFVTAIPWEAFENAYRRAARRMTSHRIAMDSVQTARLIALVTDNLQPGNTIYRYNYVKDNCATRPLRMLELAMGDSILLGPSPLAATDGAEISFRSVMRHYHRNYPWYQFGIDLALGSGIDYPISRREQAFAPVLLVAMADSATVAGRPLTASRNVIIDVPDNNVTAGPTPWWLSPIAVCWFAFAITAAVCVRDLRRRRLTRWYTSLWYSVFALTGMLLTFLIFVSVHEATSPNWVYLWLNPLCAIPAVFIWLKKAKKLVFSYQIANFVVLLAMIAACPLIPQSFNPAFLPLVLLDIMLSFTYLRLNYR